MMLRQKSSPWGRLKYLYVLPLAAFTIVAFARPEISRKLEKISEVELSEALVSPQKEKQDRKEDRQSKQKASKDKEQERKDTLNEKKQTKRDAQEVKHEVIETKQQAKELDVRKLNEEILQVSAPTVGGEVRVVGYGKKGEAPIPIPGKQELNFNLKTNPLPGVKMHLKPGQTNPLIIVDGVELTGKMDDIDPTTIESITVLKDQSGVKLYGEKAKDGVILISTKKVNRSLLK